LAGEPLFDLKKLKELGGYKAGDLLAVDVDLYSKFIKYIGKTVKRDPVTKNMVFLTCLSAYTREPINYFLRGEPSIGKTYNVTEVVKYFPKDNVWLLGGLSPKALIHQRGRLIDKNGEEINLENRAVKPKKGDYVDQSQYSDAVREYNEDIKVWRKRLEESYTLIEMSHKILVFLEAPPIDTFKTLLPISAFDARWC